MSQEFTHNEFSKTAYLSNTDSHVVKVNSRDRNIDRERNPFNFQIRFNKWDTKYTNYFTQDWWKTSDPKKLSTTIKVNNGATIADSIENIKDFRVSEIVAPRFIPSDKVGKLVENITATTLDNSSNTILLKTSDDSKVEYLNHTYKFYKLTDFNQNIFYLLNTTDFNSVTLEFKKTFGLLERYYTDTLLLNNKIYHISEIGDGYITLDSSIDFIDTEIYLPKYNTNDLWYSSNNTGISHSSTTLTLSSSGHLMNHNLTKNSIIEINDNDYFKIDTVVFKYEFKDENGDIIRTEHKNYPKNTFSDSDIETITTGLNSIPKVDVTTTFNGSWMTTYPPTINTGSNKMIHLKEGIRDLLNDKFFYLSLEPLAPPKNLITNDKLNNVIGTLYPSTQSRNYIYLVSKNVGQRYTHRNLQNIKDLTFRLYNKDGTQIGSVFENYTIDYLEKECRQTSITFSIDVVDRSFN